MSLQSGGEEALAGAGAGAAIGSIVPGVGTAIGAGVGGLAGFLVGGGLDSGSQNSLGYGDPYAGLGPAPMPTKATVNAPVTVDPSLYQANYGNVNNSIAALQAYANGPGVSANQAASQGDAAQQQALIAYLTGQAQGTAGPSVADIQLKQGLDQSLAQGRSLAQSVAATNPIAALQAAGGAQSLLQRQTIGDAAALRAHEMLNAQNLLGNTLSQKRSSDITDTSQQMGAQQFNREQQLSALNAALQGNTNVAQMQQQGGQALSAAQIQAQQFYNTQDLENQQWYSDALVNAQQTARQNAVNSNAAQLNSQRQFWSTVLQTGGAIGGAYLSSQRGNNAATNNTTDTSGGAPYGNNNGLGAGNGDVNGGLPGSFVDPAFAGGE